MKIKYGVAMLLLIGSCSVLRAQTDEPKPAYPKREFKHTDKITVKTTIEDGIDTNYVFLDKSVIKPLGTDRTSLGLMASFQYDGKLLIKPRHIILDFFRIAPECKMPLHPGTELLFDGVSLKLPESFKGWRDRKPDEEGVGFGFGEMKGDGLCHEFTMMFISQKNFLRMVWAKEVEIHIGQLRFKLTETNLEALRDLASRMAL